ncbi:hypothetical protein SARC_11231 [Sphaeroforma arctica JP610]|uniref:Uncharacterized protein n=1 Tax=Sphaeroforma arctica JP610 TaxID=667725 RepID=A0A0L0FHK7_9EUKA|nr:hypothetical protein SARC_11231 [Sphaeroforma arctica JP610]KNC76259.1 hypothetical protein SARC_11231 [Sphaeroforma arctica JP610]|eukprot:XP_014150161.1 hypothetical protein SARC_11231 [Sphaeroforma arctica JP610]
MLARHPLMEPTDDTLISPPMIRYQPDMSELGRQRDHAIVDYTGDLAGIGDVFDFTASFFPFQDVPLGTAARVSEAMSGDNVNVRSRQVTAEPPAGSRNTGCSCSGLGGSNKAWRPHTAPGYNRTSSISGYY